MQVEAVLKAGHQALAGTVQAVARFLTASDVPALIQLEQEKWRDDQAATSDELAQRIDTHPQLSVGAFCASTGRLLTSLFMKPAVADFWKHAGSWRDCADGPTPLETNALFGISLSSRDPHGVDEVLRFFWPHALHGGWRYIYLGSPIPGWREWRRQHPQRGVTEYVRATRCGLPRDPQLRYYHLRGFTRVMCIKRNYFPHERSEDHGVILRGVVPLSGLAPLWHGLGLDRVRRIARPIAEHLL